MKNKLFIIIVLLCSSTVFASGKDKQAYLHADEAFEFQKPEGTNAPLTHPLEGLEFEAFPEQTKQGRIYLEKREKSLRHFPCTECHVQGQIKNKENPHQDQSLNHAEFKEMNCFSCHNKNERNFLRSNEKRLPFQLSPQLCYQCHSQQYQDWKHGAHGKRIGVWAGKRVIQSCVDCHNPHDPAWKKRFPVRKPQVKRPGLVE